MKIQKKLINEIKSTMLHWFSFKLTNEQIVEYLTENPIEYFDTVEREDYANYLANKITGMDFPMNMDSDEYKNKFYILLYQKSKEMGYVWNDNN
jgi:hypothetical protein